MHYGRLDEIPRCGFFAAGSDFEIIEINGASSESIDLGSECESLGSGPGAVAAISTLFKLGAESRRWAIDLRA